MANAQVIRWLHISDFHTGKDSYGQRSLFKYILENVREKVSNNKSPDMVFITGDIANRGLQKEYKEFVDNFLRSLLASLPQGAGDTTFVIPGNHDVDRHKAQLAARYDALRELPFLFDNSTAGVNARKQLLPRFDAYMKSGLGNLTAIKGEWLGKPEGVYTKTLRIKGYDIGIVGINTAWLSKGEEDKEHMNPGKGLLEDGLEKVKQCQVRIVLGHHPLYWLAEDWQQSIRAMLGKYHALYLHGHLHQSSGRVEEGGGYSFLPIQAGAAFQERENEEWVNQILWCELHYQSGYLMVEPLKWSKRNQAWVLDTEAFPPPYNRPPQQKRGTEFRQDRWYLPVPVATDFSDTSQEESTSSAVASGLDVPDGWLFIDKPLLEREKSKFRGKEQIIRFFDGSYPTWTTVLAPPIEQLSIVDDCQNILNEARQKGGPGVTVMMGPGGEGKSTALKQVVCNLVAADAGWLVLWRKDDDWEDSLGFIRELPSYEGKTWLIVADEASNLTQKVYDLVKSLHGDRNDIQFFLCCRDTDWLALKADGFFWNGYTQHYKKPVVKGLKVQDARKVIRSWRELGEDGLRELYPVTMRSFDEAVNKLMSASQTNSPSEEGSLLGAMLEIRFGEGLKEHVKRVLEHLELVNIPGGTLLDAFAYIAALHAKRAEILTKEILALKLNYSPDQVKQWVTGPLGEETLISHSGKYILTRHMKIAQVAIEILGGSPFHRDVEEKYIIDLVRKVIQTYKLYPNLLKGDIAQWRYLSSEIFNLRSKPGYNKKREEQLGISLAEMLVSEEPTNKYYVVNLSQLMHRAGRAEEAAQVFRQADRRIKRDRAYYFAWGVAEGRAGHHAFDAWLSGVSLSDYVQDESLDEERLQKSLAGLATAFGKLFDKNKSVEETNADAQQFLRACAAATYFGLTRHPEGNAKETLEEMQEKCYQEGIDVQEDMNGSLALDALEKGIQAARRLVGTALQEIPGGEKLSFYLLQYRLGIER